MTEVIDLDSKRHGINQGKLCRCGKLPIWIRPIDGFMSLRLEPEPIFYWAQEPTKFELLCEKHAEDYWSKRFE